MPAAVGDNSNSPLTAPSPFHRISSAVDRQKSIIGQVSQTNSDSTERPCICNDVVLSILAEKEIEGGIVDGHVLQDYKNVNRNEKRSVQAADDKENGETVPQEDENDRQENHRITDTTQRPSNLTQKAFSDLKFGCQRALACLLEKYMVESCLDFDEKQSLFHDLDKWLHITGFYDSKHRELVLRLCEAKEALEKQLNTLGHDDNIELEAATQNSPPKGLHPMVASTSDGCCSREQHNDKRSTEQVRKREASQDLLRESYKVSRGENHRDERLVILCLFAYMPLSRVSDPNIILKITGN